jgi:hypothetical protein
MTAVILIRKSCSSSQQARTPAIDLGNYPAFTSFQDITQTYVFLKIEVKHLDTLVAKHFKLSIKQMYYKYRLLL